MLTCIALCADKSYKIHGICITYNSHNSLNAHVHIRQFMCIKTDLTVKYQNREHKGLSITKLPDICTRNLLLHTYLDSCKKF